MRRASMVGGVKWLIVGMLLILTAAAGQARPTVNEAALQQLSERLTREFERMRGSEFEAYVAEHQLHHLLEPTESGMQLIGLDEHDQPVLLMTHNAWAARTARVDELWPGGASGLELTGAWSSKLGMWDAGSVRATHDEFNEMGWSRITNHDSSEVHYHATHVAGTMVANGILPAASGMSYRANLHAWDWQNDLSEMIEASLGAMKISVHPYGIPAGFQYNYDTGWHWYGDPDVDEEEDWKFGYYSPLTQQWDQALNEQPYLLPVVAAGNHRADTGPGPGGLHYIGPGTDMPSTTTRDVDGGEDGHDTVVGRALAKNVLTVGAVNDVVEYDDPASVVVSTFSSFGPADDGRIKPDLSANGVNVQSTGHENDTQYFSSSGTSTAAASAAGAINLLYGHYVSLFGLEPTASMLKAVVIHSADEAGDWDGPDYQYGWGLMNAWAAAELISEAGGRAGVMTEGVLEPGETWMASYLALGNSPAKLTLVWNDPAFSPLPNGSLNDPTPQLVHDLDIRLIHQDTQQDYHPWVLGGLENPGIPAETGNNDVDNIEMIQPAELPAGTYTVEISHEGELLNAQEFSLIVTGLIHEDVWVEPVVDLTGEVNLSDQAVGLSWDYDFQDHPNFMEFRINRNGDVIGSTRELTYVDLVLEYGTIEYSVTAIWTNGESLDDPTIDVWYPAPQPPSALSGVVTDPDQCEITLSWFQSRLNVQQWDDGDGVLSLQFVDGTETGIILAQKMTVEEAAHLFAVSFKQTTVDADTMRLWVFEDHPDDDLPGADLYTGEMFSPVQGWNELTLPDPLLIPVGDVWVGIEYLGYNPSPAIPIDRTEPHDRGAIYNPVTGWEGLDEFLGGWLNGNPLIRAVFGVEEGIGENGLQHFIVWRDNAPVAEELTETTFADLVPEPGSYSYQVWAIYEQGEAYSDEITVTCSETPPGSLVLQLTSADTVSAGGGTLIYNATLTNDMPQPFDVQAWTMAQLPNGNEYGPIINVDLSVPPGTQSFVGLSLDVPGFAPPGWYEFVANVGAYPDFAAVSDSFEFYKAPAGVGRATEAVSAWAGSPWRLETAGEGTESALPDRFALHPVYPNPFNNVTTVRVDLPEAAGLSVTVYDVQGREVARLADGRHSAGEHLLSWNAGGVASGLYFVRASSEHGTGLQKAMLLK